MGHWQLKSLCKLPCETQHPFYRGHKHCILKAPIQLHVKNVITNKSAAYRISVKKSFCNNANCLLIRLGSIKKKKPEAYVPFQALCKTIFML